MVNRVWRHHFGRGLVASAANFGKTGVAPSHPELLDWLATEFVRSGWSVKHMHRADHDISSLPPKLPRQPGRGRR